mmetsp:Transcript_43341/g.78900  ORF Transcript_43341/g.78900 Transcript_43341/m.78900 type:complete len:615 (+) Transcript_43341:190-2034(+)
MPYAAWSHPWLLVALFAPGTAVGANTIALRGEEILATDDGPSRLAAVDDEAEAGVALLQTRSNLFQHDLQALNTVLDQHQPFSNEAITLERVNAVKQLGSLEDYLNERVDSLVAKQRSWYSKRANNYRYGPSHAYAHIHSARKASIAQPLSEQHPQQSLSSVSPILDLSVVQTVVGICILLILWSTVHTMQTAQVHGGKANMLVLKVPGPPSTTRGSMSVGDATVAVFSSLVGAGLLATPYAFTLAGMFACPLIIFFVISGMFTGHLMAWTFVGSRGHQAWDEPATMLSSGWGGLVELAFGRHARKCIEAFLVVELWGYVLSYMVISATNLQQLFPGLSLPASVEVTIGVVFLLMFTPAKTVTRLNVFSGVAFAGCCVMFIVTGLLQPAAAHPSDLEVIRPHGVMAAAGILVFSPSSHSFYPAIMQQMEEPAKFPMCLRWAYAGAGLLYLGVAIPGYLLFGDAIQPSLVQNIGMDLQLSSLPSLGWMSSLAAAGIVMKMSAVQPYAVDPLVATLREMTIGRGNSVAASPSSILLPCVLALTALVAVHFANEMTMLLNLLGSIICMNIAFVVPVACYWKLAPDGPLTWPMRLLFMGLIGMGLSFALLGGWSALEV